MATMTAAQRREQARIEYDAFIKGCPTNQLLDRLSDKWVSLVVSALAGGTMRYSDLGRKIAGVSPKMLTQTLRSLERDGILARTVTPSVPVRVDYELTPLGHSLALLLTAVKDWAETHIDEVHEARERYDTQDEQVA
ncbi:winged helix-turn-helix transcriptional regulator [Streptomyces justiciae]|uniref:Helix-turn-helix domain-containing protein n=1 Tax=Streptomyces justiciae TaxID=2780140 RepID=A0ABU3LX70_9ACTN|nr:helix-turn-helix domain-containing protein [Streptomyces justiciae]MBE8476937.1 helix-turn-helix transcriptional regulator [Streptomyces justiciae]MCW8379649.1 helix-turn-helix transcriptional regulator [Streptomyces justiciae]MDT7843834.1 helix-turn-helix domain-containing protein [Streptomyces justiciae]